MNRRNFIKVAGLGAGLAMLGSTLNGCSTTPDIRLIGRDETQFNQDDIRLKLIAYAMLSPNPHNKQPWLIKLSGPTSFFLYVDMYRLLPATDPFHRQIHLGQGAFLETLTIAAQGFGYEAEIDYFPQGEYDNVYVSDRPVAHIQLRPTTNTQTSDLFAVITQRQSTKTAYARRPLSQSEMSNIHRHYPYKDYPLSITTDSRQVMHIRETLVNAMTIEDKGMDRVQETIAMFRFNDAELLRHRDGFGLAHSGILGIEKYVAEHFILDRDQVQKDPTDFGKKAIELTHEQAYSSNTFGWITSRSNTRKDQLMAGRAYCRLNLLVNREGLAIHPMSQVLQEYEDMLPLQHEFLRKMDIAEGDTMQMLFRIGQAEPTIRTPRRQVGDLLA